MNRMNPALESAVEMAVSAFRAGGKMMICGNGGSAADSAHITGELVKGFLKRRPLPKEWDAANTHLVQEEHIRMYHEFCARIEAAFFDI